jgi:hypothetical protein
VQVLHAALKLYPVCAIFYGPSCFSARREQREGGWYWLACSQSSTRSARQVGRKRPACKPCMSVAASADTWSEAGQIGSIPQRRCFVAGWGEAMVPLVNEGRMRHLHMCFILPITLLRKGEGTCENNHASL